MSALKKAKKFKQDQLEKAKQMKEEQAQEKARAKDYGEEDADADHVGRGHSSNGWTRPIDPVLSAMTCGQAAS